MEFRSFYDTYETFNNLYNLGAIPKLAWVGDIVGFSLLSDITAELIVGDYRAADTELIIDVHKDQGFLIAAGLRLGMIGVGANFKFITRKTDSLFYYADAFAGGPPEDLPMELIAGTDSQVDGSSRYELGIGGLATIGPINVGAYIDNLLFFLNSGEDGASTDFAGIFDTMSVGASWTPFDVKSEERRGILNAIATADLKNFGSNERRELAAGVEAGLNLGNVITASARAGYRQPLPGTLQSMIDSFDPEIAVYSAGIGAKVLFGAIDITATFPADVVLNPPDMGTISDERLDTPFASFVVNVSLSF